MKRGPLNIEVRENSEKYHVGGSTQQSETNRPHARAPSSHVLVEMHEGIYHDFGLSPVGYSGLAAW